MVALGIVCILGAIVSAGLIFFGATVPVVNSILRQLLLCLFGCILIIAPHVSPLVIWLGLCPDIRGDWLRPSDNLIIHFDQSGYRLSSAQSTKYFNLRTSGKYREGQFDLLTDREDVVYHCTDHLFGNLTIVDPGQIRIIVRATDGVCYQKENYREDYILVRPH